MKCVFVPEWDCKIETEEIPLEVCKACIEARKTAGIYVKRIKMRRTLKNE